MGINQGPISLDQKYTQGSGHVFMTGIQALVRLPMAQIRRDRAAGLNTAGFVTGYRGSPLGGYDQQLFAARKASRTVQHQIPARRERGPCGHRGLGLAAAQSVEGRPARRRGRHLVRQGPRRRPLRRRVPPRQCRGLGQKRRRAVPCRRRSRRQILHRAASVRPRLHLRADALPLSLQHPRNDRDGPVGYRDVALLRLLGRHEGDHRDRGDHGGDRSQRRD